MFDRDKYWLRRKHVTVTRNKDGEITSATPTPFRGQINELSSPKLAKWTEQDHKASKCTKEQIGMERTSNVKSILVRGNPVYQNRKQRRLRVIDRDYTKKGFAYGRKKV